MWAGLVAAWRGFRHFGRRGYLYVWANLFWVALSLPIVTAPAAWAGLIRLSYAAHRDPLVSLDDFWQGFRETWRRALPLSLVNLVFAVTTATNLLAYASASGPEIAFLRITWAASFGLWLLVQYFGWVFYFAMERPTVMGALRNAAVMMIRNPLFTLGVVAIVVVVTAVSSLLPAAWFLLTGGLLAAIANSAVQDRLRAAGIDSTPLPDESLVAEPSMDDL